MQHSVQPNERVPYELRHCDDDLLVADKPSGVVTQPGKKHEHDSLLNGLSVRYGRALQNLGEARNWGLLHRLDKDTSGLVLVALRNRAYDHLREQFVARRIVKVYWAIVSGRPRRAQGVIQQPIAEITGKRKKAVIKRDGRPAVTAYRVLQMAEEVSLIEARPKTGRLHQIRVHLAALGQPILGESTYAGGLELPTVPRLCLHAAVLSFVHPTTGHRLTVHSPWPRDLRKTLKRFGLSVPSGLDAGG
jgi:23S rRNA pseudouridine1911/1915/1917 synthase